MNNNDNKFIIIEKNNDDFNFKEKLSVIIKTGNLLNENKINIVSTIDYYNKSIKITDLDHKIRLKCINDINDFNTINKYLHMIKILLETTFNEIKFGQITSELFDKKITYINTILANCKSHFEFCIKKIELTINLNSTDVINNNIYALYRDIKFIETDKLHYILYPYLNLKYKCVLGNLMVQIDKMGDIILGPKNMFYFINIIHSEIYQIIDNITIDDELSYSLNNHHLDTQILKFNSILEYDELNDVKINFIPTKKINILLESLLKNNNKKKDDNVFNSLLKSDFVINNIDDFIYVFKLLLIECRLSTINILNKKDNPLKKIITDIEINDILPCIVNNYVHHEVFSSNLIKLKERTMSFITNIDIDYNNLQKIGYEGLNLYIQTKCKFYIKPNELLLIPILFAKNLDSIFFHNIFSLWDFIWKLSILQLATISTNPEELDADLYMYLKLYIFGTAKINHVNYLTLMMEHSLITQDDIIKYKLNKIPNELFNYFSNTSCDNSDNLILYANDMCTLSNVETILLSFKNIVENHDQIN
jgi:hypothetical protein